MTAATAITRYRSAVEGTYASGEATEHSCRPALKALVEELGGAGTEAINEPRQEFAVRELRQLDVPPEHWASIIRATRTRRKRPWRRRILSRPRPAPS